MAALDFDRFDVLTFDCYGTLIDWEAGILAALRAALPAHGIAGRRRRRARARSRGTRPSSRRARTGRTARSSARCSRRWSADFGVEPTADERRDLRRLGRRLAGVPRFGGGARAAARALQARRDHQLRRRPVRRVAPRGSASSSTGSSPRSRRRATSPTRADFELAFERIGLPRERILHVAQSLFHDHVPAKRLGLSTVWVDRRAGQPGSGATPPAEATPDLVVPDMASLAAIATEAARLSSVSSGAGDDPLRERAHLVRGPAPEPILEFRIDTVEAADGHRSTRDIAGHPGGVCMVAIDDQDRVLSSASGATPSAGARDPGRDARPAAGRLHRGPRGSGGQGARGGDRLASRRVALPRRVLDRAGFTSELMHLYLATTSCRSMRAASPRTRTSAWSSARCRSTRRSRWSSGASCRTPRRLPACSRSRGCARTGRPRRRPTSSPPPPGRGRGGTAPRSGRARRRGASACGPRGAVELAQRGREREVRPMRRRIDLQQLLEGLRARSYWPEWW